MPQRRDSAPPQVAERGDIHFVFRPKVETDDPAGFADVERFYLVLHPTRPPLWRIIVIGRKRLPRIDAHERNWGFVDLVTRKVDDVRRAFAQAHVLDNNRYWQTGVSGLYVKAVRTQPVSLATKHLRNSLHTFLRLVEISRSLDQQKIDALIKERDYEELDWLILNSLMGG